MFLSVPWKSTYMEQRPTICLLVEHASIEMTHSLYMIQPPLDLSDYDQMVDSEGFVADSKYLSPVLTFKDYNFMPNPASVSLGSRVYFFGGTLNYAEELDISLVYKVQFFDTDQPELGMQAVAPMNGPKIKCCAFVADGMIYALGTPVKKFNADKRIPPKSKGSGFFERYDPSSNQWQILSDPPLPFHQWLRASLNCATVVGRRVFIGSQSLYVIFNLDTQDWDPLPHPEMAARFHCSTLFVQDSASLYQLRGPGSCKPGTLLCADIGDRLQVVKRGPLTITEQGDYDSTLLTSPCLDSGKEQVMAEAIDLDGNTFFTNPNYFPWRELFHMGGRFFCYVATAQLLDHLDLTRRETKSRGVWINFVEEVPAQTQNGNKTKFRSLASFCYKFDTNFHNLSGFICCSALGTVPDSWIKAPLKKKQVSKVRHIIKESEALQIQGLAVPTEQKDYKAEQSGHEVENAEYWKARDSDLKRLLAVQEEENRRMAAELTRKNELLKDYEAMLAKTGCMVTH